jgi:hypothetical protein
LNAARFVAMSSGSMRPCRRVSPMAGLAHRTAVTYRHRSAKRRSGMNIERGALVTHNASYVCAEGGGGRELVANRPAKGPWEIFRFQWLSETGDRGTVALIAANGQFVCAEGGGGRELVANRGAIGPWETFRYIWWAAPDDKISLQTADGSFVCAEGGGGRELIANRPGIGPWEKFSIELA